MRSSLFQHPLSFFYLFKFFNIFFVWLCFANFEGCAVGKGSLAVGVWARETGGRAAGGLVPGGPLQPENMGQLQDGTGAAAAGENDGVIGPGVDRVLDQVAGFLVEVGGLPASSRAGRVHVGVHRKHLTPHVVLDRVEGLPAGCRVRVHLGTGGKSGTMNAALNLTVTDGPSGGGQTEW